VKRDCPLDPGAVVWAYFRDSGGEAQERSVGQQLDVGIVRKLAPCIVAISNANGSLKRDFVIL
jgi:hypothetical protein